jgi:hypothetical protein
MSCGSSRRYPPELRERAARIVVEISDQRDSEWAATQRNRLTPSPDDSLDDNADDSCCLKYVLYTTIRSLSCLVKGSARSRQYGG